MAGPSLVERAEKEEMALHLPSDSKGPLSSPELVWEDGGAPSGRSGRRLRPWGVPCLALGPSAALGLLAGLPQLPPAGTSLGASLRYWAEVAKLCLELLALERFVPDLDEDGNGGLRAMWRPLFEAEDVRERLRILASAMPPICRALDGGEPSPGPIALVESFLGASVDGAVRRWVVSGPILSRKRVPKIKETSVAQRWLEALLSEDPRILVSSNQASAFIKDIRAWTAQLRPPGTEAAFRTCFRLDPPAGQEEPSPPAEARTWAISYHLQATDDRSLLIDAATIWKERSGTLTFLKRRFENPQERLLADLGRASRLFPTLEESLRSPRPAACKLSVEQAYSFLRESVPLLEESGFGVLVPPWWQKPAARLGVRLKVRARDAGKTGAGLMGLGSLVDYDWEVALGDEKLSREEFEKLSALKVPLVQVRGQWVELRPQEIEAAIQFFEKRQRGALTLSQALHLGLAADTSETGVPVVGLEAEGWISELMKGLDSGTPMEELPPPEGFRGILRPYQIRGYSWMAFLDRFGLGACLADDMGLGKTIQLIALLLHERLQKKRTGPTLLIAPMSVVGNWQREMERFAPSLKVMVHHGAERLSGPAFERQARKHDMVISTYGLAHRDQPHLASVSWERVALDEAQNIKNPSTKQTLAIRSLRARSRLALTGTPVENRLSDLWSIMEFLNPGYLGSATYFRQAFALPVEKYRDEERLGSLRRLVQPFLLRRLKSDPNIIQDLPEKMEMKVFCNLTREQASLYQAVVKDMMGKIEESEGINRKGLVLATLMKLKQVCNHPAHFLQDGSPLEGRSGKLLRLVEMLEEALAEGDRALVFTQYAEMGQMLKAHLQDKLGREVLFLHGGTSRKARDHMVRRFQEEAGGPPVFVLSLKAGGTGLNLTAANHVFHFDRWWNPAVEAQATDRAFRIGQKRNVQVHKYVCAGTLEERIDQLMEQKKDLAESVMGAGEGWLTEMSTDQLRHLLALSREAVVED
ncbi:MAG: DEAD/DEAH box helicase [Dehalococcoidia bacterium]|nr:DEAD/DEAH box helicase [Dehalococcoidia bacterium]